jgi:hypothetical protein
MNDDLLPMARTLTLAAIAVLLSAPISTAQPPADERRITPSEFDFASGTGGGVGTSGVAGIRTVVLKGDPQRAGLYTILLYVPANTRIAAHVHQDDRVGAVVSGTWYLGYGDQFSTTALKALPAGSFYTEPPHRQHFAETRAEPVVLQITGIGPSSTR